MGVLRELAILDGDATQGIKYTRQVGQLLAEQFDSGIDGELFLSVVEADTVTTEQLDTLSAICPCKLTSNVGEQEILGKLFFAREAFYDLEALPRRRTLQSILQLAGLLGEQEQELTESTFRACVYSASLPNSDPWPIPESLAGNREKWHAYARNELLSISVQGIFHALLDAYEESGLRFDASAQVVDWFVEQPEARDALAEIGPDKTFGQCLDGAGSQLPEIAQWGEAGHEVQLAENIARLSRPRAEKSGQSRSLIILAGFQTLIALAHRRPAGDNPYGLRLSRD
jgi:hypothetical protein